LPVTTISSYLCNLYNTTKFMTIRGICNIVVLDSFVHNIVSLITVTYTLLERVIAVLYVFCNQEAE